ncbi:MAG: hypothetical protein M3O23_07825 [Actinomycetota bacterium]|nr:hypothetical protein [Actinomycetota bacterium]
MARATDEEPGLVGREAAAALAAFAEDPVALVTACRRLVDRQPTAGPVWWLAARVLGAADPEAEAWQAAELLWGDPTPRALAAALPDECRVTVLGRPEQVTAALVRRGDVEALVVDVHGEGRGLVSQLRRVGTDAHLVDESGLGAAVAASSLVLLEASALGPSGKQGPSGEPGPSGMVAVAGSRAAAAVARSAGVPFWAVAGVGRALPEPLWRALAGRMAADPAPWTARVELVVLGAADLVAGPDGLQPTADAVADADCPAAPELLRAEG